MSSLTFCARKRSNLTPASDIETRKVFLGTLFPLQDEIQQPSSHEPDDAEQLRQGHAEIRRGIPEKVSIFRMVSPVKLHKIADNLIVDDIEGKDLAVELLFL